MVFIYSKSKKNLSFELIQIEMKNKFLINNELKVNK